MSGPKVTRVITKREIMSISQGRINALSDAINEWSRCAKKHSMFSVEKDKDIEDRFKTICKMYEQEQFRNVQKQCSEEIFILQNEINQIQEKVIAEAEKDLCLRRRLQYSAETLIRAYSSSGMVIPNDLHYIAMSAVTVDKAELSDLGSNLNRFLAEYTFKSTDKSNMTPLQNELSKQLADGEELQTFVEWQSNQAKILRS